MHNRQFGSRKTVNSENLLARLRTNCYSLCPMNRLFFGDNLGWLRDTKEFPDASVDLVYLDPPDE